MKINYPQTIIDKSEGTNNSEMYLNRLCNETFLSLWSYSNIFRDQGRTNSKRLNAKGDGKELCDLLVIFDNHVFIFSDKQCAFSSSGDIQVDWSRWYKKAIRNAANQIWGAERWLFEFPDSVYLDKGCTQPFPLTIPSKENVIVHRIVVAHGASNKCIENFGGTGSFMIYPHIIGDMHIKTKEHDCIPFAIGQVYPDKGYVHVFDDVTLEVVMKTVDTISDFTRYISKKEEFILSGKLFSACGEDDLLAYYLQHIDENEEHTFLPKSINEVGKITILEGFWENYCKHPSRIAQIKADEISYAWDNLIEKFIYHITTGTSYFMSHPDLKSQEEMFRFLAKENRTRRRALSTSIHDLIAKTPVNCRTTRTILPTNPTEPYYVFLLLPKAENIEHEKYREIRRKLLSDYLKVTKIKHPNAVNIIGLATETGLPGERSEDIVYLNTNNWNNEDYEDAERIEKELIDNGLLGRRTMFRDAIYEYPNKRTSQVISGMKGRERNNPCPCGSGKKIKKCCGKL